MKQSRYQPWLTSAVLVTFAVSGWAFPAVQQNPQPTGQTSGLTQDEIAARRRAYEQRQAAERNNNKQTPNSASQGPQGTERALYDQEQAHRLRLGRIARLKTLLRERGDTEKLAKLDEIAAMEQLRYTRFTDIQKRKLNAEEAARADRSLARGRQRAVAPAATREAAVQRERQERERLERERQKQDNKPQHPKPASRAGGR